MRSLLRHLTIAACFLLPRLAAAEETKPLPGDAQAATLAWLRLVDDGKYADSWKEASSFLKGMVTEEKWKSSADFTHDMPRAPRATTG